MRTPERVPLRFAVLATATAALLYGAMRLVVAGEGSPIAPEHVRRVLTEADLCREAGLPDLETLRSHYYSARDLRGMADAMQKQIGSGVAAQYGMGQQGARGQNQGNVWS